MKYMSVAEAAKKWGLTVRRHLQSRRSRKGRGLSDEGGSLDEHYEILQLCDYGNVELCTCSTWTIS